MSRCLKGIPHYNPKIVAPKMQSDIDKALRDSEMKMNQLIDERTRQVRAGILTENEKKTALTSDLKRLVPNRKVKEKYHNFANLEAKVRNMPIAYNEGIGSSTRKGDRDTERLIKKLRDQEAMGIITVGDRQQALLEEIAKNVRMMESWSKQDAINMRTPGGYG